MVDNSYNPAENPDQLSDASRINQQPDKNSEDIRRTIEEAAMQVRKEEWFSTEADYIKRLKESNQNVEQLLQKDPNAVQNISKQQFEEHSKNHDQYMLEQAAQKIESAALPPPSQRIDSIGSLQAYLADGDQELAKTLREYGSHIGESRVNSAFENRFREFREKRSTWQKSEIIKAVDRTKLAETAYESEEKFFKALTETDPELKKALDGLMDDEKKQLLQETEVKDKIKASLTDFQNKKTLEKKDGLAGVDQKKLLAEAVENVGKNLPKKERHFSTEKEYLAALQEQNPQLQKLLTENPRLIHEKIFMRALQTRFETHDEAHNTLQKQKVLALVQSVPFPSPEQAFASQADFLQYLERSNPRLSKLLTDYGNHIFAGEVASAVGQKLSVHNARHTNHLQKEARSLVSKTELPDEIEVSDASKLLPILAEKNPQLKSLFAQNSDTLQNDAEIQNLLLQKLTTLKAQSKKETEQEAAPDYSEALQKSVEMFADSKSDIYGSYDEAFAAYRRTLTSETLKSAATQEKAFLIAELQKHPTTIFVVDAATKAVLQKTNGALIEQAGFRSYPDRIAAASVLQALAKSPPADLEELDVSWLQQNVSADVATRFARIAGGAASTERVLQSFAKNVWGTNTIPDAAKSAQAEEEVAEAPEESDQNPELQSYLLKNNTKQFLERQGRNTTETHNALAGVFSLIKKYRFDKITLEEMMRSNSDIIAARHQLEAATGWNFTNHKEKYATLFALLNTTWSPYLVSLDASKTVLPTNDADRHLLQQETPEDKEEAVKKEKNVPEALGKKPKSESLLLASQEVETAEEEIAENEESTVSLQKSGELQTEELQTTSAETPEQTPSAISQSIGADLESFLDKQVAKDRERDDKRSARKEEAKVQPEATQDAASEINLIEEKDVTAKANEEADLIDLSAQEENPAEDEEAEQTTTEAASVPEKSQEEEEEEKLEEKTVAVLPEDSSADLLEAPENKSIFQESAASPVVKKDVVESEFPNEDAEFQSPEEEQAESADFAEIDSREEIIETSAKEEKNTENILVENKEADDDLELEELISITSVPKSETEENVAEKELKGSEDEPPQQEEIIEEKEESEKQVGSVAREKSAEKMFSQDIVESQEIIEAKEELSESTAENTNENLPEVDADIVETAADNIAEDEVASVKEIKEEVENEPTIKLDTSLETEESVESEEEEEEEGIEAKAAVEVVESEEEEGIEAKAAVEVVESEEEEEEEEEESSDKAETGEKIDGEPDADKETNEVEQQDALEAIIVLEDETDEQDDELIKQVTETAEEAPEVLATPDIKESVVQADEAADEKSPEIRQAQDSGETGEANISGQDLEAGENEILEMKSAEIVESKTVDLEDAVDKINQKEIAEEGEQQEREAGLPPETAEAFTDQSEEGLRSTERDAEEQAEQLQQLEQKEAEEQAAKEQHAVAEAEQESKNDTGEDALDIFGDEEDSEDMVLIEVPETTESADKSESISGNGNNEISETHESDSQKTDGKTAAEDAPVELEAVPENKSGDEIMAIVDKEVVKVENDDNKVGILETSDSVSEEDEQTEEKDTQDELNPEEEKSLEAVPIDFTDNGGESEEDISQSKEKEQNPEQMKSGEVFFFDELKKSGSEVNTVLNPDEAKSISKTDEATDWEAKENFKVSPEIVTDEEDPDEISTEDKEENEKVLSIAEEEQVDTEITKEAEDIMREDASAAILEIDDEQEIIEKTDKESILQKEQETLVDLEKPEESLNKEEEEPDMPQQNKEYEILPSKEETAEDLMVDEVTRKIETVPSEEEEEEEEIISKEEGMPTSDEQDEAQILAKDEVAEVIIPEQLVDNKPESITKIIDSADEEPKITTEEPLLPKTEKAADEKRLAQEEEFVQRTDDESSEKDSALDNQVEEELANIFASIEANTARHEEEAASRDFATSNNARILQKKERSSNFTRLLNRLREEFGDALVSAWQKYLQQKGILTVEDYSKARQILFDTREELRQSMVRDIDPELKARYRQFVGQSAVTSKSAITLGALLAVLEQQFNSSFIFDVVMDVSASSLSITNEAVLKQKLASFLTHEQNQLSSKKRLQVRVRDRQSQVTIGLTFTANSEGENYYFVDLDAQGNILRSSAE